MQKAYGSTLRAPDTLFVAAHPDDTETMLGYSVLRRGNSSVTLVATDGTESTVNHTLEPTFVRDGLRRHESIAGLGVLGVAAHRQVYLGLQDGGLPGSELDIAEAIVDLSFRHPIRRIFTLGERGYDGHPDHIATHYAAAMAAKMLRDRGADVGLFGLSDSHDGQYRADGGSLLQSAKLTAMSNHASQFRIHDEGNPWAAVPGDSVQLAGFRIDPEFWDYFRPYHPLILDAETFDPGV